MSENTGYQLKISRLFFSAIRFLIVSALLISCATAPRPRIDYSPASEAEVITVNPYIFSIKPGSIDFTMTILGDLHGYDSDTLVDDYAAWSSYRNITKKVFDEKFDNTRSALDKTAASGADFIVIPGDLTVNGDKASHLLLAQVLLDFEKSGKQAYVIPGNHDVNNSKGLQFLKNNTRRAKDISAKEFSEVYSAFGYSEAFSRDKNSLSYAVEPLPGIVLLCLDTAQWKRNRGYPFIYTPVEGRIKNDTFRWAEKILAGAGKHGKEVYAVHHHPLDEEFIDSGKIIELYKKYNVRLAVAGHRHKFMISRADDLPMLIAPNLSLKPGNALEIIISGDKASAVRNPYNFSE